jgi:fructose-specific phosphotransferase system IIC component
VLFIINSIAVLGFQFMIPVMAAFIGFSIAGRAAMVSSFVTAFLLTQPGLNL